MKSKIEKSILKDENNPDNLIQYFDSSMDLQNQQVEGLELTFSQTKTIHSYLESIFTKQYEEVIEKSFHSEGQFDLVKLYITAEQFIQKLKDSKLTFGAERNNVHFHFQVKDRSSFLLSLSNNFDREGASTVLFKTGSKNFLGLHDTLQIEMERQIGIGAINWACSWRKENRGNQLELSLHQSERAINKNAYEQKKGISFKIQKGDTEITWDHGIRSNRMNMKGKDDLEFIRNQDYCSHLDFLPSKANIFGVSYNIVDNLRESLQEQQIKEGLFAKVKQEFGKSEDKYLIRYTLVAQQNYPLFRLKRLLYNFKYSSLQTNFNFGYAQSWGNLHLSDTFTNQSFRGYTDVLNTQIHQKFIKPQSRYIDCYAKLDFKLNIHRFKELQAQSARIFYYATFFTQLEKNREEGQQRYMRTLLQNGRVAGGIGIAMDVGQRVSIEVLLNMFHLGKKKYDKTSDFQLRVSMND